MQIKPLTASLVVQVQLRNAIETWQVCCTLRNIPDGIHFDVAMATFSVPTHSSTLKSLLNEHFATLKI